MDHPCRMPDILGGGSPSKIIHCNVWGDIEVDALARAIIDTWAFQRLHYIRQMGVLYKVFPTAQTTRFQHALGCYQLTKMFLNSLWRNQPNIFEEGVPYYLVPIAALCKNLGYGPFSHLFDRFLMQWKQSLPDFRGDEHCTDWTLHEHRSCDIIEHIFTDITFPFKITQDQMQFMKSLLSPDQYNHPAVIGQTSWFVSLIRNPNGDVDAPTLDYLLRDCNALGMPCAFDIRRIIANVRVIEKELCFCERIQDDIWGVLSTRHRLYTMAYHHPKNLEFEAWIIVMFQHETFIDGFLRHVEQIIRNHDMHAFLDWTDNYFLAGWLKSPMWRSLETRVFPYKNTSGVCKSTSYVEQTHEFREIADIRFYHRQRPLKSFPIKYQRDPRRAPPV